MVDLKTNKVRTFCRSRLASAVVAIAVSAHVYANDEEMLFSLPPGTAADTLKSLSKQAEVPLLFSQELVESIYFDGFEGESTVDEVLLRLLLGSGLVAERTEYDVILISQSDPYDNNKGNNVGNSKRNILGGTSAVLAAAISGIVSAQDVQSQDDSNIEVVEVKGIRSSLKTSMDLKRNATSIQDSIVAEDIGKFPDQNVAESLQRISGVSISRTNGEGTAITVRGLGPKFNAVKLNNRTIATSERGREFDFQILPSELIGGADVVKASRANLQEGGIGSYVTINTARPLDKPGQAILGSVNLKYNDLAEEWKPQFTGLYSNTFADDTFGVLIGVSRSESESRIDAHEAALWDRIDLDADSVADTPRVTGSVTDTEGNAVNSGTIWYPGRAQFMTDTEERERTSANVTLQWAPTDNMTHTFDYFYTDFERDAFSNGMQAPLHRAGFENVIVSENNTVLAARKNSDPLDGLFQTRSEASTTSLAGYNFAFDGEAFSLGFDLAYSESESTPRRDWYVPNIIPADGLDEADYIAFDSRAGDVIELDTSVPWSDPAGVRAHWNFLTRNEIKDEVLEFKVDSTFHLNMSVLESVEVGLAYTDREKSQNDYNSGATQCGSTVFTCGTYIDMDDSLFSFNSVSDFLSDVSGDIPRDFVLINDLGAYHDAMRTISEDPAWGTLDLIPNASVANKEEITALYTQANFAGELGDYAWSGNAGLRYVSTDNTSEGFAVELLGYSVDPDAPADDGELVGRNLSPEMRVSQEKSGTELLPSVNFKLDFNNGLQLNTAAARVMTRPAMEDVGVNVAYGGSRLSELSEESGNPDLEPYLADQFDLSLEYYRDNGDSFSVNFFYKEFDSWISKQTFVEDTGFDVNLSRDGGTDLRDVEHIVTRNVNRGGVELQGFEVAAIHYFDYLPGILDGFGVQANYTYTDSEDSEAGSEAPFPGITPSGAGVEGFSNNAYNFIGFYDRGGFQARLAYNWREAFLIQRLSEVGPGLPEHADDYGQFDFSSSYDINDMFTVRFEVINATNENILQYADVRERVSLIQYSGRRFQLGMSAKF